MNSKINIASVFLLALVLSACQGGSGDPYRNQVSEPFTSSVEQDTGSELVVDQRADDVEVQNANEGDTKQLSIRHHKVECESFHAQLCLLVKNEDDSDWMYFYDQIEGFDYQWGVNYEIVVKVEKVETLMADVSNRRYTLLSVLSEEKESVDDYFQYSSKLIHDRIIEVASGYFSLLGSKVFTCSEEVCDALRSSMSQQHAALLSFQHREDGTKPLKLLSVVCSDSRGSFAESCLALGV